VKNLSDSKRPHLSKEELLELSKISSGRNVFMSRFVGQNLVFRCASVFLFLSAVLAFVFSQYAYTTEIDPTDVVAQSYRGLFRVRLLIVIALAIGLVVSFYDGRIFRGFLLSVVIVLSYYSVDAYYFYNEYLSRSDGVYMVLYYTRPTLMVALIIMYINYNKS
jgi:hypothetical protein